MSEPGPAFTATPGPPRLRTPHGVVVPPHYEPPPPTAVVAPPAHTLPVPYVSPIAIAALAAIPLHTPVVVQPEAPLTPTLATGRPPRRPTTKHKEMTVTDKDVIAALNERIKARLDQIATLETEVQRFTTALSALQPNGNGAARPVKHKAAPAKKAKGKKSKPAAARKGSNNKGAPLSPGSQGAAVLAVLQKAGHPLFVSDLVPAVQKAYGGGTRLAILQQLTVLKNKKLVASGKKGLGLWGLPSMAADLAALQHRPDSIAATKAAEE